MLSSLAIINLCLESNKFVGIISIYSNKPPPFFSRCLILLTNDSFSQPSSRFDELPDEFDPLGRAGSFDDGDPQTTNLYVGNLSPQVRYMIVSIPSNIYRHPYF